MILPCKGRCTAALVTVFVCLVFACESSAEETSTIVPDYENNFYKKVSAKVPGLRIAGVTDARTLDRKELSSTLIGVFDENKNLVLDEPVTDFVKRSFESMLGSNAKADETHNVELDIENFRIEHKKTSMLNNHITFEALMAVQIIREGAKVKAGYLYFKQEINITASAAKKREELVYQGMVKMAYELAEKLAPDKYITGQGMQIETKPEPQPELVEMAVPEGQELISGLTVSFMYFTESLMNDSYGGVTNALGYVGGWDKSKMGFRLEFSIWGTSGTPNRVNPEWNVTSSNIKMGGFTLGGTFLYSLRGDPTKNIFLPYVGAGIDGFFGAENIGAAASRKRGSVEEGFEADAWGLRAAFATHALLGARMRVTDKYRFVLEARWTQCGKGSNADLIEKEKEELFDFTLYNAVKRSDFNFTGWSIHVGLEW